MTLHSEQDAIKQAVEAGWFPVEKEPLLSHTYSQHGKHWLFEIDDSPKAILSFADMAANPAFWQALGKARGWEKDNIYWLDMALSYFSTILLKGDTRIFWKSLPNP
jgi:hypothetical protein